jgi:tetratricopeptide (TPR) repeat protein
LKGLSRDEREVLETGAVMGEVFRLEPIACILAVTPLQVHRAMRALEQGHRLTEPVEGGKRYRFNHPLVRQVVYERLPKEMRVEYHRAAVECLLREGGSGMAFAAELASHAKDGRHPDATKYLKVAGDLARKEYNNAEAVHFYESALELAEEEQWSSLMESLGETEFSAGRVGEASEWFGKARAICQDRDRRIALATRIARVMNRRGMYSLGEAILSSEEPDETTPPLVTAKWKSAEALVHGTLLWNVDKLTGIVTEALQTFESNGGSPEDIMDCLYMLATYVWDSGTLGEAEQYFKKGLEQAEAKGMIIQVGRFLWGLGSIELEKGHLDYALELFERSQSTLERAGEFLISGLSSGWGKGYALMARGDMVAACEALTRSIERFKELGSLGYELFCRTLQATCLLEMNRLDEAEQEAIGILSRAEPDSDVFDVKMLLAEILVARNRNGEAVSTLRELVEMNSSLGNKRYAGLLSLSLAHALAASGQREEPERLFSEMGRFVDVIGVRDHGRGLRWWGEASASWGETGLAREKLEEARRLFAEMGAEGELRKVQGDLERLGPNDSS